MTAEDRIVVLDPTAELVTGKAAAVPKLSSFGGKIVGLLWNGRATGDRILHRIIEIIKQKHELKDVVLKEKPYLGNIAPPEIFEELVATCDVVITGVGD
jgi:hypothetical protein